MDTIEAIEQKLLGTGLSLNETKVYLVIVRHPFISPALIAKKALIQRPTVYTVCDKLERLGLIFRGQKNMDVVIKHIRQIDFLSMSNERAK